MCMIVFSPLFLFYFLLLFRPGMDVDHGRSKEAAR